MKIRKLYINPSDLLSAVLDTTKMVDDYNNYFIVKINSVADGSCLSWKKRIQVPPSISVVG